MMPGLARLMEESAAGGPQRGLADDLWRLAYTRGHLDVDRARPYLDHDHGGMLVYARTIDVRRSLAIVDTGKRLVGAVGPFGPLPRLGSAVRLSAAPSGTHVSWRLVVDEALVLPISVCFDRSPVTRAERQWIGILRHALDAIRDVEAARREALAARRRELPALANLPTVDEVVRERVGDVRRAVERETQFTRSEAAEIDAVRFAKLSGTRAEQKRAHDRETAIVAARQERFDALARARLEAFRAQLPAWRERMRAAEAGNEGTRRALQDIENAYGDSRARSASAVAAATWLDAFEDAPFCVEGLDGPLTGLDDATRADEVLRAIALLARALPRTSARVAV